MCWSEHSLHYMGKSCLLTHFIIGARAALPAHPCKYRLLASSFQYLEIKHVSLYGCSLQLVRQGYTIERQHEHSTCSYDGAEPTASSVAAANLQRLAYLVPGEAVFSTAFARQGPGVLCIIAHLHLQRVMCICKE